MKKLIILLTAVFMLISPSVKAEGEKPIYADRLEDGAYEIEVTSSSSMFRVTRCELNVENGGMTAVMTLGGTGYEKLFMGTGEEALAADDDEYIYFEENPAGEYTYTVPVEALDIGIDCAAWSIRKQEWYDRTLVFEASALPPEAFKGGIAVPTAVCAAVLAAACAVWALVRKRGKQK